MTTSQAAEALGMTKTNVVARCKRGTIKGKKISSPNAAGWYWDIPQSEIQRLKEERKDGT